MSRRSGILMMDESGVHRFVHRYRFLSNFYLCAIRLGDSIYPSVEHAYQAAKTTDAVLRERFQDPHMPPSEAKRRGRHLPLHPDWDVLKQDIMYQLLLQKFSADPLREMLLSTGTMRLEEGNDWHDTFWGICYGSCYRGPHQPQGENRLGGLLMRVRQEIGRSTHAG